MPKRKVRIEAGTCPKCDSNGDLDYDAAEIDGELVGYPWKCPCGATGVEWYRMEFSSHAVRIPKTGRFESFDA
jgi:hypothetical protein